ncbi:MAG: single-stranded DNA-binding protein [Lachnospiraceae bacterium]|nr:single-stranded DNA-binding protein [Lachnospiraceae bacterium]
MNKVLLCGRLTRDPEIRYSQGERQMAIARYTLAVDRRGRGRNAQDGSDQTADFIQCVAFDRAAEFAEKYLRQGTKLIVTGRIQTGSYTNRDGQRVYTTDVIVEDQEFAESRNASAERGGQTFSDSFQQREARSAAPSVQDAGDGFMNIPDGVEDEGLPFN